MFLVIPACLVQYFSLKATCLDVIRDWRLLKKRASSSLDERIRFLINAFRIFRAGEFKNSFIVLLPFVWMVSFLSSRLTSSKFRLTSASILIPVNIIRLIMVRSLWAVSPLVDRMVFSRSRCSVSERKLGSLRGSVFIVKASLKSFCIQPALVAHFKKAFRDDLDLLIDPGSNFLFVNWFRLPLLAKYSLSKSGQGSRFSRNSRKWRTSRQYELTVCSDLPSASSLALNGQRAPIRDSLCVSIVMRLGGLFGHGGGIDDTCSNQPVHELADHSACLGDGNVGLGSSGHGMHDSVTFQKAAHQGFGNFYDRFFRAEVLKENFHVFAVGIEGTFSFPLGLEIVQKLVHFFNQVSRSSQVIDFKLGCVFHCVFHSALLLVGLFTRLMFRPFTLVNPINSTSNVRIVC